MKPRIGIIGCGRPGRGQARGHVHGYLVNDCEVVALCDIAEENAQGLREEFGLEAARVYTDSGELLAREQLDCISVCLWPHLHAPVTLAAARSGNVRAIHCEKPVAPSWSEAQQMVHECAEAGVQLTFNHQRRFNIAFARAREMIEAGEIGELQSMEAFCPDLFDWGTHWLDMMHFFNGETPARWALGQVETRAPMTIFGVPVERRGMAHFEFENGVRGTLVTGRGDDVWNGLRVRANGTRGAVEVGQARQDDGFSLRALRGDGWQGIEAPGEDADNAYPRVIENVISALESNEKSLLDAENALRATELIFAIYESARRRERVELPLQGSEGHPLVSILSDSGTLPERVLVS